LLKEEKKKGSKKAQKKLEKEEKVQEDQFQVDLHDPRFSAIYDSHLYALDPSHPQYFFFLSVDYLFLIPN